MVDSSVFTGKRVLLVEFTGIGCVNCPEAALVAQGLHERYGERLTVVEMHPPMSSFTAIPRPEYDFRIPEADVYFRAAGASSSTGLPTGELNLSSGLQAPDAWGGVLESLLREPAEARLSLAVKDTVVTCSAEALFPGALDDARVLLWLVEDSIVAPQKSLSGTIPDYIHSHVLRAVLSSNPWGDPLSSSSSTFSFPSTTASGQPIEAKHCALVGLLLRPDHTVLDVLRYPL